MNRHDISLPDCVCHAEIKEGGPKCTRLDVGGGAGTSMDEVYSGSTAGTGKHGKNR